MLESLGVGAGSGGLGQRIPASELDRIDHALVFGLQKDGRASAAALARDLGLDQRTVRRRVERLLDEKVIRIAAVTDPRQLGYHSRALVCVKTSGSSDHGRLYQEIAALPEVDYFTVTSGRFDFQAEVFCADDVDLNRVISEEFRGRPRCRPSRCSTICACTTRTPGSARSARCTSRRASGRSSSMTSTTASSRCSSPTAG
ncbi:Lrp/AsnC family transcriptional regulator [Leucobacter soli]|uniref:Lrp/AsnC family transcriptional regulator n=1 Tax=Leucobacter soli TaxID=2812850 RepID=UPI00360C0D37